MNPKKTKEERQRIGTYRGDRDYDKRDARDPEEKKPFRPSELEGRAAKFWYKHVNSLWDSGWLRRDNVDVFTLLCEEWGEMKDLDEWFKGFAKGEPRTRFMLEVGQFVTREVERPQSKLYEKLKASVYKKCKDAGIVSDKPATGNKKKKPDPNAKTPITEFGKPRIVK